MYAYHHYGSSLPMHLMHCSVRYYQGVAGDPRQPRHGTRHHLLLIAGKKNVTLLCSRIFCHTRLHLGFSAKLKIWHVPACKVEPQNGIIFCLKPADRLFVYMKPQ